MEDITFGLFVPPEFEKKPFSAKELYEKTGRNYIYASRGRHAIYHILKSNGINGNVVVPAYVCHTVFEAVENAGCTCVYCDIDLDDLNICFDSFRNICNSQSIQCVIVPSLYGNPADLASFEEYCNKKGIFMIDDSAQSFGAILNNRMLSTFGNAGLFAFSPGKATPGPMGALYWSLKSKSREKKHCFIHKLIYWNYWMNRKNVYRKENLLQKIIKKILLYAVLVGEHYFNLREDDMCSFESEYIGGLITASFDYQFKFRNTYAQNFKEEFKETHWFRIVSGKRGLSQNHKIVLVFNSETEQKMFSDYMKRCGISTYQGYKVPQRASECNHAKMIENSVIELPIENDERKMRYLFDCVKQYKYGDKL